MIFKQSLIIFIPTLPNSIDINALNERERSVRADLGASIKRVYRAQNWTGKKLAGVIKGVPAGTFRNYAQQSFHRERSLHVLAAIAFVSNTPLENFYLYAPHRFNKADNSAVMASLVASYSVYNPDQFRRYALFLCALLNLSYGKVMHIKQHIYRLQSHHAPQCIPDVVCIESFKAEYYNSIAKALAQLRHKLGLSSEKMSEILGVSEHKYSTFENPTPNTFIPATLVLRVKRGFKLCSSDFLLDAMQNYTAFKALNQVYAHRREVIDLILADMPGQDAIRALNIAKASMAN